MLDVVESLFGHRETETVHLSLQLVGVSVRRRLGTGAQGGRRSRQTSAHLLQQTHLITSPDLRRQLRSAPLLPCSCQGTHRLLQTPAHESLKLFLVLTVHLILCCRTDESEESEKE